MRLIVTGINKSVNARLTPILHPKIQIQSYHVVIVEHNLNWKLYKLLDRKENEIRAAYKHVPVVQKMAIALSTRAQLSKRWIPLSIG